MNLSKLSQTAFWNSRRTELLTAASPSTNGLKQRRRRRSKNHFGFEKSLSQQVAGIFAI
jgi:hypothetical protein